MHSVSANRGMRVCQCRMCTPDCACQAMQMLPIHACIVLHILGLPIMQANSQMQLGCQEWGTDWPSWELSCLVHHGARHSPFHSCPPVRLPPGHPAW
jgi:hypothetical protein